MFEIELKFQIPEHVRLAVDAAVAAGGSRRTRLQAVYFDTVDRRLAAAGLALRLRKEGRRWVQTLKGAGPNAMQRLEHNVPLIGALAVPPGAVPGADPLRHAGTAGGDLLAAALHPRDGEVVVPRLLEQYRTDIWRRTRSLRAAGGVVELAFDSGEIFAGERRWPVCELEIELLRGQPGAVIDVARRWVRRYGLWLDLCSKAERGDRLARGVPGGPVVKAGSKIQLERTQDADAALHVVVVHCLRQILPNASEVADGHGGEDHVHQLRVGLRRLRTALRFFDGLTSPVDAAWSPRLAEMFGQLGSARDRDALQASLLPALRKAGAPMLDLPAAPDGPTPTDRLREKQATLLLLDLLAWQVRGPVTAAEVTTKAVASVSAQASAGGEALPAAAVPLAPNASVPLADVAGARLQRWHRRVVRAVKGYDALDDEARHALRKRVKRLRYATEFVATLYKGAAVARYLERLAPLQDSLGRYNDLCVGLATYRAAVGDDPRAWFAIGWLTARREVLLAESGAALKQFARCKPFW